MWPLRDRAESSVTCVACGAAVPRSAAREYDKHGDRYDRADKAFEHLCKPCDRELCHQPRGHLEATLVAVEAEGRTPHRFAAAYLEAVRERSAADAGDRER